MEWRDRVDEFQQRYVPLAVGVGVVRKFGDDRAGRLAALIAYYAFFSLFPLLLVATTILSYVFDSADAAEIENSILSQIPLLGSQNTQLSGSATALVVGFVVAILAGLRCMLASQDAMNEIWNVPRHDEPNFLVKRVRALGLLALMFVVVCLSTAANQVVAVVPDIPGAARLAGAVVGVGFNMVLFAVAYQTLTAGRQPWRALWPGAVVGSCGYAVVQWLGTWYIDRTVAGAADTYGTFAVVIGLLTWLFLVAQIFVMGAVVNVVLARRLWPRRLLSHGLTEADRTALVAEASQRLRADHLRIEVHVDPIIRPWRRRDADAVLSFVTDVLDERFGRTLGSEDAAHLLDVESWFRAGDGEFWVAFDEHNTVVGTVGFRIEQGIGEISFLFVHSPADTALAQRLEATARAYAGQTHVNEVSRSAPG